MVNNAGIMLNGDILTTTEEQFDRGPTQLKKFQLEFYLDKWLKVWFEIPVPNTKNIEEN